MSLSFSQKIISWFMLGLVMYWIVIRMLATTASFNNYFFSFLIALIPLFAGIVTIANSKGWHSEHGLIHRGMFFIGVALILWACGELIWSYYNFFVGVAAPYPSAADFCYLPSEFFYCIGAILLSRGAGADVGLRKKGAIGAIVFISLGMLYISYFLLVTVARSGVLITPHDPVLKTILDIAYPLGDFFSLTASVILSGLAFKYLLPRYRHGIISVLFGVGVMFAADLIFSYTTTRGTYFNGQFGDLLFAVGMFLLSFGGLAFALRSGEESHDEGHGVHFFSFLRYH